MRAPVLFGVLFAALLSAGCAASSTPPQPSGSTSPPSAATSIAPQPAATGTPTQPPAAGSREPAAISATPRGAVTLSPRRPAGTPFAAGELDVTLERSGGITGRSETFSLKADGSVDDGKIVLHVDGGSATASQLAAQIAATGIYTIAPGQYLPANSCCDRYEYDVTLTQNGKTYSFVMTDGSGIAPPALMQTVRLISQYIDAAH